MEKSNNFEAPKFLSNSNFLLFFLCLLSQTLSIAFFFRLNEAVSRQYKTVVEIRGFNLLDKMENITRSLMNPKVFLVY
jgi:hypothetical protein